MDTASSQTGRSPATGVGTGVPDDLPEQLQAGSSRRRVATLAAIGVVTALLISTLPGLSDVRQRFADANPGWLVAMVALEVASCLAYVVAFRSIFCSRLSWRFSYQVGLAEQATNVLVPAGGVGGLALGAWVLRQGGMGTERIAHRSVAFFVITSAPNFICAAVAGLLLAGGVLPGAGPLALTLPLALLACAAILTVATLPWILERVGVMGGAPRTAATRRERAADLLRRGILSAAEGVRDARQLLRTRQGGVIVGAVGYMAFDVAALAAAFAALGSVPPIGAFLFAYVIGQLGGLIPLPGGIGGTDGGLIGALTLYGSPLAQSTAAVLAYRSMQLGIPAVLGSIAFIQLRRTLARGGAPAALCEPFPGGLPVVQLPARA